MDGVGARVAGNGWGQEAAAADGVGAREWLEMGWEKKLLGMRELGSAWVGQSLQIAVGWLRQGSPLLRLRAEYYRVLQMKVINCIVTAASRFFFILVLMIFL